MEDVEYLEEYEELILSPHRNFEDNIIEEITDGYVLGMEQPSFMEDIAGISGTIPFRDFLHDAVTEPLPSTDRYAEMQSADPKKVCNEFPSNSNLPSYDVNEDGITKKKRKKRRIKNLDAPSSEDELHDTNAKKSGSFLSGIQKSQPQIKGILVGGPSIKEAVQNNIAPAKSSANELNDDAKEERELPFKIFKNKATGEVVKKGQVRFIRKSELADAKRDNSSKETEKRTDYSSIIDKLKKKSVDQGISRKAENVTTQNNSKKESTAPIEVKKKPKPKIVPLKSEPTDVERRLWSLKNEVPTRRKSQEYERDKIKIQPQRRKSQYFLPSEFTTTIDDKRKSQEKSKPVIQRRKSQYTSPAELALEEKQKRLLEKEKITSYFKMKSQQALILAEKKKPAINSSRAKQSKHLSSNQQKISAKRPYTDVGLNEAGRKEEPGPSKRKRPQIAVKNDEARHETPKSNIASQRSNSDLLKQHIKSELAKNIAKSASQLSKMKDILSQSYSTDSDKSSSEKKVKQQSSSVSSKEKPLVQNSSTKTEINKEKQPKDIKEAEENKSNKSDDTKDKEPSGDAKKAESIAGSKKAEPNSDTKKVESIANTKKIEPIANTKKVEPITDSKKAESIVNTKKAESIASTKKIEPIGESKKIESKESPKSEAKKAALESNVQQVAVDKKVQGSPETPVVRRKPGRPPKKHKLVGSSIKKKPIVTSVTSRSRNSEKIIKSMRRRVLSVRINRRFVRRYLEANANRKKIMTPTKNSPANSPSDSFKKSQLEACSSQTRSDTAQPASPLKRSLRKKKDKEEDDDVGESLVIGEVHKLPELSSNEGGSKENNAKATDKVEQIKAASSKLDNNLKKQAENPDLENKLEQKVTTTTKPIITRLIAPATTRSTKPIITRLATTTTTKSTKRKSTVDHNKNLKSNGGVNLKQTKTYPGKVTKPISSAEVQKQDEDALRRDHLYKSIMDLLHIPQHLIVETRLLTTEEFKQKTSLHSIARAQARLAQHKLQIGNDASGQNVASAAGSNLKKLLPDNEGLEKVEGDKSNASPQAGSGNKASSATKSPKFIELPSMGKNVSSVKFFLDRVEDMLNDYVTKEVKRELQEITQSFGIKIQNLSFKRRMLRRNRFDDSKYDPHTVKFMYDYLREIFATAPNNKQIAGEAGNVQKSGILYIDRTKASTSTDVRPTNDVQGIQNDRSQFGRFADTSHVTNTSSPSNPVSVGGYDSVATFGDVQITTKNRDAQSPEFHFRKIVLPNKNQAVDDQNSKTQVKITKIGKKTTRNVKPNLRTTKKVLQSKQQSKPKVHTLSESPMAKSEYLSASYPNITFRPLRCDSKSPEIITPDAYVPSESESEEEDGNNTNPSSASVENAAGIVMEDVHNSKVRLPASTQHSQLPSIDSATADGISTDVNASQKPDYHVVVTRTFKKILLPMDPISASDVSPENAVLPIIAHSLNSDSINHQTASSSRDTTERDPLIGNVTEKDIDSADTFYTEDYSLDTGYQFKCDKCTIILSSRPLIQEHVQRAHFRFMNNCYLCKAHLDQSDQLQHFLNNHSTASISK